MPTPPSDPHDADPAADPPALDRPFDRSSSTVMSYADLAAVVRTASPLLGPVRLVAVDGCAGSGKTTFGGHLGAALDAQVVHTDDLLDGWSDTVAFWPRLDRWVLEPLRQGRPGRYRRYDWTRAEFAEWHEVPVAGVLLLEGVTAARARIRPELTLSVWVDAPAAVRLARGMSRDGEALRPEWERWMAAERAHLAIDRTPEHVDVVVDGNPAVAHDPRREFVALRGGG